MVSNIFNSQTTAMEGIGGNGQQRSLQVIKNDLAQNLKNFSGAGNITAQSNETSALANNLIELFQSEGIDPQNPEELLEVIDKITGDLGINLSEEQTTALTTHMGHLKQQEQGNQHANLGNQRPPRPPRPANFGIQVDSDA